MSLKEIIFLVLPIIGAILTAIGTYFSRTKTSRINEIIKSILNGTTLPSRRERRSNKKKQKLHSKLDKLNKSRMDIIDKIYEENQKEHVINQTGLNVPKQESQEDHNSYED